MSSDVIITTILYVRDQIKTLLLLKKKTYATLRIANHAGKTPTGGRILPHQRDADFSGELLGDKIVIEETHVENVQSVEQFSIDVETKKNHRNRIKHIYKYWEHAFPDYYEIGVKDVSEEEENNVTRFYWKNNKDLVYEGLNSKFLKVFVASKAKKTSGKTSSFEHIRKYFDAVQWGAKEVNAMIPVSLFQSKEKILSAFKKKVANEKKKGNVDENEADSIPINLYQLICLWAVEEGNIMVWVWTIMQWNLMARLVNIEPITLRNIKGFQDSLQFLYDLK